MKRYLAPLALAGLLTACNTGDSVFEWDEETAAMLAAQEAEAEAAEGSAEAEAAAADMGAVPEGAVETPLLLLAVDGTMIQGTLVREARSTQVRVRRSDGDNCTGGLVEQSPGSGTFALNCESGTVWFGDYSENESGDGAWTMQSSTGIAARAVYGADVAATGASPEAFETLWQARGTAG